MDNYNALSKSAILTKLALDGYFIDLLTLNSFIKSWQIEAIYENEFGIEFFDNNSYLTILEKLKGKYNETKSTIETLKEQSNEETASNETATPKEAENKDYNAVSLDELAKMAEESKENDNLINLDALEDFNNETPAGEAVVDKAPVDEGARNEAANEVKTAKESPEDDYSNDYYEENSEYQETIMPSAMKNLTPGPVSPNSNLCAGKVHPSYEDFEEDTQYSEPLKEEPSKEKPPKEENLHKTPVLDTAYNENDADLADILAGEFTPEEIEKANKLIEGGRKQKEEPETKNTEKETKTKDGELDLMQLAQSFAQNLTSHKEEKEITPAALEEIFDDSGAEEQLEELKKDINVEEYEALKEDFKPASSENTKNPASVNGITSSNLTAENVREIIREEISRQSANVVPVPGNSENIREIIREIVKQTADVAPQNAFKLDISNRTLDLIAKSIAKKIAVKLNEYYKLNSAKQDTKLQLFRERTIELKERNQALAEENKKLKNLLLESNKHLSSFKPTIFGLFKFVGNKKR